MFRGLSSFTVEMIELMAILKRNNNKTLVLGDELCSGSEIKSATVIICYMLETLANTNTSFITATHIHDINSLNIVVSLDRVKTKHLKITFDEKNDMLIYDRNLLDGQGETFYGLLIAKYLMKDKQFNERTNNILKEYTEVNKKKSNYNSNVYVDKCTICESTKKLETHHIVWQKDFDKNEINDKLYYLQKNDPSNLVILCSSCHDKVDRNEIKINGWINTSNGRKFDYENIKISIASKKDITNELVEYIKELKNETTDVKMVRIMIKEKFNKKVSLKSIASYW
jgi:DNA mismatch repair protein MutS